jgi:dihydroorotate dehydrogenase
MLYPLARTALFRLPPETAHHIALTGLQTAVRIGLWRKPKLPQTPQRIMGIEFPNPVGLAAGLDKNGQYLDGLAALGFGFIEIGTVTPRPQPGNPRPRLFRLPPAQALINRLGFNNQGVDGLLKNIQNRTYRGILGINIGKNGDTPLEQAANDYRIALRAVYPQADYVTVNISSPNTPGLRDLQYGEPLQQLLTTLKQTQAELHDEHGRYVPLALKLAPDLHNDDIPLLAETLLAQQIDAVIATNTTFSRAGVTGLTHATEKGGLSGAPVFERSTELVHLLHARLGKNLPIIAVGGILKGADAVAKLQAGARLVQLYTGLIYRGPGLLAESADACHKYLSKSPKEPGQVADD